MSTITHLEEDVLPVRRRQKHLSKAFPHIVNAQSEQKTNRETSRANTLAENSGLWDQEEKK